MPWRGPARSERVWVQGRPAATVLAGGLALTIAAFAFGAAPLFVPGIGFILLGLIGPAWVLACARAATVQRRLSATRIVEDEPLEATIVLHRGHLGLPGAEIQDPIAGAPVPVDREASMIAGEPRVELRVVCRIRRRGRHAFGPPSLSLTDSFGLLRIARAGEGEGDEVLVLPRTEPIHWLRREHRRAASGQIAHSTLEPMGAGEVDGLRQYMPGTPASRIHWPALARGAGLLERRLVSAPEAQPLIVLDARVGAPGAPASIDALDAAVRAAASLALALGRAGGASLLLPGERVPVVLAADLAGWPALHTRLALIEPEQNPLRGPALREESARGPLIYVAAQHEGGMPRLGARATELVLVVPLGTRPRPQAPVSFEVAGCAGYLLRAARSRRVA